MKINFFLSAFALTLISSVTACSSEEAVATKNPAQINTETYVSTYKDVATKSLSASNYISPTLYYYKNNQDALDNNVKAMEILANHYYEQLNNGSGVNEMVVYSTVSNNMAVMSQIAYLDGGNQQEIQIIKRNPIKGIFEPAPAAWPGYQFWHGILYGNCGEGWEEIGSTNYSTPEALAQFLAGTTGNYTYNNAAPGYDINFSEKFGLSGVVICAQKIKTY